MTTPPAILLDLLNSPIEGTAELPDALGDDASAALWLQERGGDGSPREIGDARAVRTALSGYLRGQLDADALAPWIGAMRRKPVIGDGGLEWHDDTPAARRFGARVVEEWSALQGPNGSRIRPCAAADCRHFLIDRSRANGRRWHSMETCGNREKSRRHYAKASAA